MNKYIRNSIASIILATSYLASSANAQSSYYDCISNTQRLVDFIKKHPHIKPADIGILVDEADAAECTNDILIKIRINGMIYQFVKDRDTKEDGIIWGSYKLEVVHSHD